MEVWVGSGFRYFGGWISEGEDAFDGAVGHVGLRQRGEGGMLTSEYVRFKHAVKWVLDMSKVEYFGLTGICVALHRQNERRSKEKLLPYLCNKNGHLEDGICSPRLQLAAYAQIRTHS